MTTTDDYPRILERLGLATDLANDALHHPSPDDAHYRAFGINRKAWGSEPMLTFIFKDGNRQAFAYTHLYRISFDPAKGVTIQFTDHVATIQGRGLADGFRQLTMHRAVFVAEADSTTDRLCGEKEAVVTKLQITERRESLTGPAAIQET